MKTGKSSIAISVFSILLLLGILFFGAVPTVHAAEIDGDGIVNSDETINDDLFLSEDTVRMDGTINGLLFAAGNTVTINGEVNGDVFASARTVVISQNAKIDGNLFTGAQNIIINGDITGSVFAGGATLDNGESANIGSNLYFGGYSYTQSGGAKIGKDVRAGLYQASLQGETGQDAVVYGGAVEVGGKIGRNANFFVSEPSNEMEPSTPFMTNMGVTTTLKPGLRISPSAAIGGKLTYTSKQDQKETIKASPAGGIVFQTPVPEVDKTTSKPVEPRGFMALNVLSRVKDFASNLISLLIIGALLLWKVPALLDENIGKVKSQPGKSAGMGFVTILVGYAGAGLAFFVIILLAVLLGIISLGGLAGPTISLGLSLLFAALAIFGVGVTLISKVIIATLAGKWIYGKLAANGTSIAWPLVIGVIVYAILRAIPILGILVGITATLLGVGAMWLVFKDKTASTSEPAI